MCARFRRGSGNTTQHTVVSKFLLILQQKAIPGPELASCVHSGTPGITYLIGSASPLPPPNATCTENVLSIEGFPGEKIIPIQVGVLLGSKGSCTRSVCKGLSVRPLHHLRVSHSSSVPANETATAAVPELLFRLRTSAFLDSFSA